MLIIISGPSCSGKTTAQRILAGAYGVSKIVSTTTREIRDGEKDGVDYNFCDIDGFNKKEMIDTTEFCGNNYGVEKSLIVNSRNALNSIVLDGPGEFNISNFCDEKKIPYMTVLLDSSLEVLKSRISESSRIDRIKGVGKERSGFIYENFNVVLQTDDRPPESIAKMIHRSIPLITKK